MLDQIIPSGFYKWRLHSARQLWTSEQRQGARRRSESRTAIWIEFEQLHFPFIAAQCVGNTASTITVCIHLFLFFFCMNQMWQGSQWVNKEFLCSIFVCFFFCSSFNFSLLFVHCVLILFLSANCIRFLMGASWRFNEILLFHQAASKFIEWMQHAYGKGGYRLQQVACCQQ